MWSLQRITYWFRLTDEICIGRVDSESSKLRSSILAVKLLVEDRLEVGGWDWLVEVLEVDVVVDKHAALAEGLNLQAVERVPDEGVAVNLGQLGTLG